MSTAVVEATALWTQAELEEAHTLLVRAEANGAHWELADWLLEKEPVGTRGQMNGSYARIRALAAETGQPWRTFGRKRATAYAWPKPTRCECASFVVHHNFTDGGPKKAAWRHDQLLTMTRNSQGRATMNSLREWRDSQGFATGVPKRVAAAQLCLAGDRRALRKWIAFIQADAQHGRLPKAALAALAASHDIHMAMLEAITILEDNQIPELAGLRELADTSQ